MPKELSKLQKRILVAIADVTVNIFDTDEPTEVKYRTVFHAVADHWWKGVPSIPGECRYRVAVSSFSRAVWGLIHKRLVGGCALAWMNIEEGYANQVMRWQGGGRRKQFLLDGRWLMREDQPRLKMLYLTNAGWEQVEQLRRHDVNEDRQHLNGPETAKN